MVANPENTWIGLEYFANEGDELWQRSDAELIDLGIEELMKMRLITREDVLDSTLIRMLKTYPAYFGSYERFDEIREFTDSFEGLYLLGRNGQHRYNNQDHSMLTAMEAVDNIVSGRLDRENIWQVNAEESYHEEKPAS